MRGPPRDAERYEAFDRLVRSLARFLGELGAMTPPDIRAPGLGDALAGLKLGRTFRGLGKHDARTITRVLPMAVADFVAEAFETDAIQAAIAWRGVQYASLGPWSAGSAAVLLMDSAGNDGGAAGQTVFARGGPGALASALEGAALASGVTIRTGAEVTGIASTDGRATGVVLASGEEIAARAVVSGLDPKRTLVDLVDPVALGPSLGWRAGNIRQPGVVAKVNLVLGALPRFPSAGEDEERLLRGRIVVAPGIDAMERAFDAAKYGRISEEPILEATIPSLADPLLVRGAAPGTQVMSVVLQYAPYSLRDASWDDCREALGDLAIRRLETVAPGIGGLVTARQVITPLDLERSLRVHGRPPAPRASQPSTSSSCGGRSWGTPATASRSTGSTCVRPEPIRAAGSPAGRGRTRRARSWRTCASGTHRDHDPAAIDAARGSRQTLRRRPRRTPGAGRAARGGAPRRAAGLRVRSGGRRGHWSGPCGRARAGSGSGG